MKSLGLTRHALAISGAAASLAGCGGAQAGGSGTMPMGTIPGQAKAQGHSWMLPEAKSGDLLYISDDSGTVRVYSYPGLKLLGQLNGLGYGTEGLCVDAAGDVFVPAWEYHGGLTGYVYEFAHGGTEPIEILTDGNSENTSCSVDPTTHNLAVTDFQNVQIFQDAQGTPTTYVVPNVRPQWAAYDNDGNLFVDGYSTDSVLPLAELPKGSDTFTNLTLNQTISMWSLQWNNGYLTIAGGSSASRDRQYIYRVAVSGYSGTIVGTTSLTTHHVEYDGNGQFWVQGHRIMGAGRNHDLLALWHYPAGGSPIKRTAKHFSPWGVVVSVARSGSRIRQ